MILRAMKYHEGALAILRPACRALANLASTVTGLCMGVYDLCFNSC